MHMNVQLRCSLRFKRALYFKYTGTRETFYTLILLSYDRGHDHALGTVGLGPLGPGLGLFYDRGPHQRPYIRRLVFPSGVSTVSGRASRGCVETEH